MLSPDLAANTKGQIKQNLSFTTTPCIHYRNSFTPDERQINTKQSERKVFLVCEEDFLSNEEKSKVYEDKDSVPGSQFKKDFDNLQL